ncbi:hypothetical protein DYBT9275_04728 [Dyadobacter sp. CECT 9275]|uniref:DUF2029 domain-containing protein n=1 Tax=Dyadobacter helix TaxID=2822344 RepID=A0A916JFU5_9BACT|nr:hypothetical protein [Dyadobacter sp. CECT 9275]CAG5010471.1 hypothetical protein DYBT9275_04728 [Dyadobacter sp. CECT 9275]
MSIVYGKIAISLACTILVLLFLLRKKQLSAWLNQKSPAGILTLGWICFRLLPFVAIYLLANFETTSDVNGFWDEASKASMGQIVYRDFWSPYSPLYAYFIGIWLKLWYHPKMIVLVMAVMDGIALLASWHFFRPFQTRGQFLFKSLIYLVLPGSLILCIIGAQEDVWMWLFVILAYLVRERTLKVVLYALVLAFGLLLTKAIFVLILVPLFILEKEKIQLLVPMLAVGIVTLAILYPLVGWEFTQPMDEAQTLRAPNIPAILNPVFNNNIGVGQKFWNWIGLLSSVGLGLLTAWRLRKSDFRIMLSRVWVVLYATMMIVQQSAYSNYIFLFLIPLVFFIIDWNSRKQVFLILLFNILCVVHPSYWWRLGMPCYLSLNDIVSSAELFIDYIMQSTIVLLTGYFIWLAFPKASRL